jgi:hypothetical protein
LNELKENNNNKKNPAELNKEGNVGYAKKLKNTEILNHIKLKFGK